MEDTIDNVAERLARLEVTVAQGFHENKARFHEAELRDQARDRKIDVVTESLRGDIQTVAQAVTTLGDEMRRTTSAIREEHAADREILRLTLENHARRLHDLESK